MLMWTPLRKQAYSNTDSWLERPLSALSPTAICSLTAIYGFRVSSTAYYAASTRCHGTTSRARTESSAGSQRDGSYAFWASAHRARRTRAGPIPSSAPAGFEQPSPSTEPTNRYADGFTRRDLASGTSQRDTSTWSATPPDAATVISAGSSTAAAGKSCCWSAGCCWQRSGPT